ncbi:MAG: DUF3617 family protein [Alphaproteobacteria bacterium]|nr:DUF3617 family protein [Alphaproteobacteria bacterium]
MKHAVLLATAAVLGAAIAVPATAASHVKPGLWEMKIQSGQAQAMPDMSQLPPSVRAQMKAHGVQMNGGGGITSRHCITPAEANMDKPQVGQSKDCHGERQIHWHVLQRRHGVHGRDEDARPCPVHV